MSIEEPPTDAGMPTGIGSGTGVGSGDDAGMPTGVGYPAGVGSAVAAEPTNSPPAQSALPSPPPAQERIRQIVAVLDGIEGRPLAEHAELYGDVHTRLQAALSEIDGPAGG